MPSHKDLILGNVHEHLNVPGFFADLLDEVLEPALKKVVEDSSNPFDDILMAAVYPTLELELNKLIEKYWDELVDDDSEQPAEPGEPV